MRLENYIYYDRSPILRNHYIETDGNRILKLIGHYDEENNEYMPFYRY